MPASRLGYIHWYFRDWLLSRTRLRLDPDQCGAYLDILCLMYDSEDGTVEWEPEYLARFTRVPVGRLEAIREIFTTKNGRLTHPRVQAEIRRIERKSDEGRENAKRRWKNADSKGAHRVPNANPMLAEQSIAKHSRSEQGVDSLQESTPHESTPSLTRNSDARRAGTDRPGRATAQAGSNGAEENQPHTTRVRAFLDAHPDISPDWAEHLAFPDHPDYQAMCTAYRTITGKELPE